MSNSLAIATVTAALADVITKSIQEVDAGAQVIFGRPQNTPPSEGAHWMHLCLYQVMPNAALRNEDLPTRTAAGELRQKPQVALDLHYLLAFYGKENEFGPQRMLGAVTRDLYAKPVLSPKILSNAINSWPTLAGSNLDKAIERVKLTQLALSLEDLSKLWSVFFQTPHALSIAYHASVVLIEAEDAATPAPPVLQRGEQDRGVEALLGSFPLLESIHISFPEDVTAPEAFPSIPNAWLGLSLVIKGKDLAGDSVNLKFTHPLLPTLIVPIAAADRSATAIHFTLPDDAQEPVYQSVEF
jgi:Pvc16 N-terminal domain